MLDYLVNHGDSCAQGWITPNERGRRASSLLRRIRPPCWGRRKFRLAWRLGVGRGRPRVDLAYAGFVADQHSVDQHRAQRRFCAQRQYDPERKHEERGRAVQHDQDRLVGSHLVDSHWLGGHRLDPQ
jgi:hypothetical protein